MVRSFNVILIAIAIFSVLITNTAVSAEDELEAVSAEEETLLASANETDSYHVGAGDVLKIIVWKNEEISGDYLVRPDGRVTLPLVGDVISAGRTTEFISAQISQMLKEYIETPYVSVIISDAASNIVYVLGEVVVPGAYKIMDKLTVLQALALAGGFTEFARRDEMVLVRLEGKKQTRINISFRQILRSEDGGNNLLLKRGDTLVVP
jgi:polysaccharide export outer membrane protein